MESIGFGDLAELPPQWRQPERLKQLIRINAQLDLLSGITTVRDLGSTELLFQVRDEIISGKTPGPRIVAAGHQLVKKAPGAYMDSYFVEYDGSEDARSKVRQQVALGADVIKIRLTNDRPLPSMDEMRAMVEEAHRLHCRVAVHTWVPADQAVQLAVDAGVDSIEHNAPLRAKGENVLPEMAKHRIALTAGGGGFYVQRWGSSDPKDVLDPPASRLYPPDIVVLLLSVGQRLRAQTDDMKKQGWNPEQVRARFVRETQSARTAGVLLVFGTDCGGELMVHGQQYKALYGESQMGSTPMQALLMATRDAARALGKEAELGTVERGKVADLVILDADPLADLRNLRKVYAVMKDGRLYIP
jgi:imidazolonepropionase-like amidohydrolase